jgi:peptide/nickel transport system substrate-binding protein
LPIVIVKSGNLRALILGALTAGLAGTLAATLAHPAMAQKSKDTFRMSLDAPIQGISYYLDPQSETVFETEAVFDNLVIFNEKSLKFEPLLAKSWTQVDAKTLEFQLRDDVKWHDGDPFTADDVVTTLSWLSDPKTMGIRFKGNWAFIDRVEKIGPHTVRVIAKEPTPYALTRLAYLTSIEAAHAFGKAEDKVVYSATKPVGTGMYKVVEIDRNKGITLERNPDYKHGGVAKAPSNIGKIQMLSLPDSGTRTAQFMVHNLDMLRAPTLAIAEDLAKTPGIEIAIGQGTSFMYMAIDAKGRTGNKALTDVRVRRAMMMAVNRDDIQAFVTNGRDIKGPKAMCYDFQAGCAYSKPLYPYDPAGAKKLLAQAGYADGFDLEITTFARDTSNSVAQIVGNQLRAVGIRTTVQGYPTSTYGKRQADNKLQVMVAAWTGGGNNDVQGTFEGLFAVPPSRDYSGDSDMIDMAFKSLNIIDPAERNALDKQIFDRSMEMAYFTPLGPNPGIYVHHSEVSVDAGAYSAYGANPEGIRWK